ncbi:MAG: hypothetical protein P8K79_04725 [Mariniblastus sp.]|nr:hypothetical protein [Mariniblastus sp.]
MSDSKSTNADQPDAQQPDAQQPAAQQPAAQQPPAKQPPTKQPPAAQQPPAKQPAAKQPDGTDPADDADQHSSESSGQKFIFFNAMPSWMVSFLSHVALILILALLVIPLPIKKTVSFEVGELADSSVETLDINLEVTDFETTDPFESEIPDQANTEISEAEPLTIDTTALVETSSFLADDVSNFEGDEMTELTSSDLSNETSSRSGSGKDQLLRKYGGNAATEKAVQLALEWLAKHQLPDGGWNLDHTLGPGKFRTSAENGDPGMRPEARYGATALALLPFLGNGQTHLDGKYKKVVKRGLEFLMDRGKRSGRGVSYHEPGGTMYAHGLVAIVFNEAFAMSKDARLAPYSQGTIWFIEDAQDVVGGGWRYSPRQAGDTSAVGWQVMALKSGKMSGLDINKRTYKLTNKFLDAVSIDSGAIYGYADKPGSRSPGHKARTAVGLLCRMYMGWDHDHAGLTDGVEWMAKMEPDVGQRGYPNLGPQFARGAPRFNMYYNYYATQVMKHYGGDTWKKWNGKMRDFLVKSQSKEGDAAGSWFFKDGDHGARVGGRLYVTSLACMTLEIYYRYLPLYGNSATDDEFPLD